MNMHRYVLTISFLSVLLLSNNAILLGMEPEKQTVVTVYQKPRTFFPFELMIRVAAEGDGEVKNRLRKTCGFFNKAFTKDNLEFISHPYFTAHKKDIEDMVCSAVWFNDIQKEKALARHNVEKIDFVMALEHNSCKASLIRPFELKFIRKLRSRYNDSSTYGDDVYLDLVLEPAFNCAVRCNDVEMVKNITPKMKNIIPRIQYIHRYSSKLHRMNLNRCCLMQLIQKDREELFKIIATEDPFGVVNWYANTSIAQSAQYALPFLDTLIASDISQDLKDKYCHLYRECGGKTKNQLEEEKVQK